MFPFLEHSSLLMTPFEPIYLSKGDRRGKCVVAEGQEVAARLLSRPPTQHLTLQAVLREKPSPPPSERHLCNLPHTQHNTHTRTSFCCPTCFQAALPRLPWLTAQFAPSAFMSSDVIFTQVLPRSRLRAGEPHTPSARIPPLAARRRFSKQTALLL